VAAGLVWGLLGALATTGAGQVPLAALRDLQRVAPERHLWRGGALFAAPSGWPLAPLGAAARAHWVTLGARHRVLRVAEADFDALAAEPGLTWTPPRHLLMDQARSALRLRAAGARGAGTGAGVVIGIVDAGVDIAHPDFRRADGTTRVAWWIDFASDPAGLHPELEAAFGCAPEVGLRCQILDAADLDERLQNAISGDEPRDALGHGTHVASIAAGNGLGSSDGAYVGIAPEATLIVARITGATGNIADSDVVLATQFVFERAAELGMPAVVNLSLGGDFGAHDGSSELSQVLASFVDAEQPGRAIVVAAGNSGQLFRGLTEQAEEPLGIHNEVQVPAHARVRVPLLTPPPSSGADMTDASVFVWLNLYPATGISVGLELPDGTHLDPIALGSEKTLTSGELSAAVIHGLGDMTGRAVVARDLPGIDVDQVSPTAGAAVILIDGRWSSGGSFAIELEGAGRAELWAQSEGDLAPEAGSLGALFPAATAQQTVTIPATHPALIAVGASVNRVAWTDHTGAEVRVDALPVEPAISLGGAAFFSSAGPNATGQLKPDVLAPGGFVIAAMSGAADPRNGARGIFSGGLCPGVSCQVVSDRYAVNAGTSMAAPMVSGAVALLFEREPTLTQSAVRALLVAGTQLALGQADPPSRAGGGVLDVAGSFDALTTEQRGLGESPDAAQSRLEFASAFALSDSARSLDVLVWLRDVNGSVFDAAPERIGVDVTGGSVTQALSRAGPGLYRLAVSASENSGGGSTRVQVRVDGTKLLEATLPIAGAGLVPTSARDTGCSVVPRTHTRALQIGPGAVLGCSIVLFWLGRRRASSVPHNSAR
jgi:subtilisin family serine protease